jgi:hypothetical protein
VCCLANRFMTEPPACHLFAGGPSQSTPEALRSSKSVRDGLKPQVLTAMSRVKLSSFFKLELCQLAFSCINGSQTRRGLLTSGPGFERFGALSKGGLDDTT